MLASAKSVHQIHGTETMGHEMISVLGIDAAWGDTKPSGVALIRLCPDGGAWDLLAVAPSYNSFIDFANGRPVQWGRQNAPYHLEPTNLLNAAERLLCGNRVSVVSVDMPMSMEAIVGQRVADHLIAKDFVPMGCGPYTPTIDLPGQISVAMRNGFNRCGYQLAVGYAAGRTNSLIETYPHPVLLRLLNRNYRVPYKVDKRRDYLGGRHAWPRALNKAEKLDRLLEEFQDILTGLRVEIRGIPFEFLPERPYNGTFKGLKTYEDALDALVCAWVGAKYLEGNAMAYGDESSAIWVPNLD